MDESAADDEALYAFWAFIERRRSFGRPEFDLEHVVDVFRALRAFERGDDS